MKKEDIREYLLSRDLRAMDLVRRSEGLIGLNQASGLVNKLRKGIGLSNTSLTMMFLLAKYNEILLEDAKIKLKGLGVDDGDDRIGIEDVSVYVPGIDEDSRFDDIYDKISLLRKDLDEFKVSLVSYLEQK